MPIKKATKQEVIDEIDLRNIINGLQQEAAQGDTSSARISALNTLAKITKLISSEPKFGIDSSNEGGGEMKLVFYE